MVEYVDGVHNTHTKVLLGVVVAGTTTADVSFSVHVWKWMNMTECLLATFPDRPQYSRGHRWSFVFHSWLFSHSKFPFLYRMFIIQPSFLFAFFPLLYLAFLLIISPFPPFLFLLFLPSLPFPSLHFTLCLPTFRFTPFLHYLLWANFSPPLLPLWKLWPSLKLVSLARQVHVTAF